MHPEAGVQINCLHLSATAGLVGAFKGMRGLKDARSAGCTMVHRADARVGAHDDVLGSMAAEAPGQHCVLLRTGVRNSANGGVSSIAQCYSLLNIPGRAWVHSNFAPAGRLARSCPCVEVCPAVQRHGAKGQDNSPISGQYYLTMILQPMRYRVAIPVWRPLSAHRPRGLTA